MAIAAIRAVAERIIDRAEKVIFCPSMAATTADIGLVRRGGPAVHRVAILLMLCHKPNLHRPADKGCRVDVRAGCCVYEITEHFQRSNEHFSRHGAATSASCAGRQESQMPK